MDEKDPEGSGKTIEAGGVCAVGIGCLLIGVLIGIFIGQFIEANISRPNGRTWQQSYRARGWGVDDNGMMVPEPIEDEPNEP